MPVPGGNRGWPRPADAGCCLTAEVVSKPGAGSLFTGGSSSLRLNEDWSSSAVPLAPASSGHPTMEGGQMLTRPHDDGPIIARVAALDIGQGRAGVLRPGPDDDHPGKRLQEVAA